MNVLFPEKETSKIGSIRELQGLSMRAARSSVQGTQETPRGWKDKFSSDKQ